MPGISVIVPVYKAEKYLHSCVDSILSQTFSDFDVYLVNDGSPDRSGEICGEYAEKDSRIHVIYQENRGQASARNRALSMTDSEWICFVDSDDLIHPQMLQRLWDAAHAADAGVSLCAMAEAPELPDDFFAEPSGETEVFPVSEDTLVALHDREEYPAWVACGKLIRREYVMDHLFCEGKVYEDNEAVCHWVCRSERLVRIPDRLYWYRTNPGSTTQSGFTRKKLDYLWALEQLIRFYDGLGYGQMKERFAHRYARELANCWEGVSYLLEDKKLARQLERRGKDFSREMNLSFTQEDRERMLEAMHPKLIKLYWPARGVLRTLRSGGIRGLLEKITKRGRDPE